MTDALSPLARERALSDLRSEPLDLLVVGGGATGCGTALDAAARGLRVGLVEQADIASGTSSRSSKLVHGGLRYLQHGQFGLVREALRERDLLLTTLAPHLVEPLPFILPLRRRGWERMYVGAGLALYDSLGGSRALPRHRHLSRTSVLRRFPSLRPEACVGGIGFHDARMDDSRLAVAIARTAQAQGAVIATYAEVTGRLPDGPEAMHRISVTDRLTGQAFTVSARAVALCVGVWAPELAALISDRPAEIGVARSKGVHLRLPRSAITGSTALIVPTSSSVLFVLPSRDHWLVGTTDTPWKSGPDEPTTDPEDVDYLLGLLRGVVSPDITARDVTHTFAGLRPLVVDQRVGGDTAKASREHSISRVSPGVLAIVGGKWTTYRVMARDMVDTVLGELGRPAIPCRTDRIPLAGSERAQQVTTPEDPLERRYGSTADEVRRLIAADPELGRPLVDTDGFLRAEVVHAVVHDGAMTLDDVVERRLRFGLHLDATTPALLEETARLMSGPLGWDAQATADAVLSFRAGQDALR
jgi:glycerol-3-phosphate dehydrogenase